MSALNSLARSIARFNRDHPLSEKWLLAPSLRVGYQWLDTVTAGEQAAVNVRVKTIRKMAVDLAATRLFERGLRPLRDREGVFITGIVFNRLRSRGKASGYLLSLEPGPPLLSRLYRSLSEIRLAGLGPESLSPSSFEVKIKGTEIAQIAAEYLAELKSRKLADYADILQLASKAAIEDKSFAHPELFVLVPDDLDLSPLERKLLETVPAGQLGYFATDWPCPVPEDSAEPLPDSRLVAWLTSPADAPEPKKDGTVKIFRAKGETNEVRQVLRCILAQGYRMDQVEVLHTDAQAYVPLFFELIQATFPEDSQSMDELPATFAEGLPVRYSRPGRALAGWLDWIEQNFPQIGLVHLVQDGLIEIPGAGEPGLDYTTLAGLLRKPGIGLGAERYLEKIDLWIGSLQKKIDKPEPFRGDDENGEQDSECALARLETELAGFRALRETVAGLIEISPADRAGDRELLECARKFLSDSARSATEFDNYARKALIEHIDELRGWAGEGQASLGFDLRPLLKTLPAEVNIMGSGPQPGKLHVANISSGGHSARPVTFIVGLDDSRYPGIRPQDPILLDAERTSLSDGLPTAQGKLDRAVEDFARLLARLRATVALSFSSFDPVEDREKFPSPVLLAAFRVLSGQPDIDQGEMLSRLAPPASFAPPEQSQVINHSDWWLWRLCTQSRPGNAGEIVHRAFPHLERGEFAESMRSSADYTPFDGLVAEAGKERDPTKEDGPVMSVSALETIGRCPLAFFYKYVLQIEPPEEPSADPSLWLEAHQAGSLLHQVFYDFISSLLKQGVLPRDTLEQQELVKSVLRRQIEKYKERYPPASESAFRNRYADLILTVRTFLAEETRYCTNRMPVWLEASIGMPQPEEPTALDTLQPETISLPGGDTIRVRARVDRVDRIGHAESGEYAITDYKTGSSWRYSHGDPFRAGKVVQHAVYFELVGRRLKEVLGKGARSAEFSFFFPGRRDRGLRLRWSPDQLESGGRVVENLCRVASAGAFLATNDSEDCKFCLFKELCGDVEALATRSRMKLENSANKILEPMRHLRSNA